MARKKKHSILDEHQKLKREMLFDKVAETLREQPGNYISALEEIGFKYYEEDDPEEMEEKNAEPRNQNQRDLIAYLEGSERCTDVVLETYLTERNAEETNHPLIRRYFRKANRNLKKLLSYGLDRFPGSLDLLADLAYFHEFENILSTLIPYYTRACMLQENLTTFSDMAQEFYWATYADGYDALRALRDLFPHGSDKRQIIDFMISEEEKEADSDGGVPI